MRVLVTNPEVDAFTRYLLCWSNKLLMECGGNVQEIFQLTKRKANRGKFEGILRKKHIDVILLNGHGTDGSVFGDNSAILDVDNVSLLAGKIVHAMSCSSAKRLGSLAVKQGAKAYVGYDEPFFAPYMDDKIVDPLKDSTAALFLDPAFIVQKALINGKTPSEAVALSKNEYNRSIVKALTSPIQSDNDQFVGFLLWDRDHLIVNE